MTDIPNKQVLYSQSVNVCIYLNYLFEVEVECCWDRSKPLLGSFESHNTNRLYKCKYTEKFHFSTLNTKDKINLYLSSKYED